MDFVDFCCCDDVGPMFGQENCVYQKIWYAIRGSVVVGWGVGWLWCWCWLVLVVGCWLLVVGGWWLVVGGWWLVVGGWWLVVGVVVVVVVGICNMSYIPIACTKLCKLNWLLQNRFFTSPPTENGDVDLDQSNSQCEIAMLLSKCIILHVLFGCSWSSLMGLHFMFRIFVNV